MMNIDEAAKYLDLHVNTVYKLAQSGKIPCTKLGNQWRFDETILKSWLDEQMTDNMEPKPS